MQFIGFPTPTLLIVLLRRHLASFFFAHPTRVRKDFCASTQYLTYFIPIHLLFCWNDVNLYLSGLKWRTVGPFRPWNVSSYALACGLQWHFVGWAKKKTCHTVLINPLAAGCCKFAAWIWEAVTSWLLIRFGCSDMQKISADSNSFISGVYDFTALN